MIDRFLLENIPIISEWLSLYATMLLALLAVGMWVLFGTLDILFGSTGDATVPIPSKESQRRIPTQPLNIRLLRQNRNIKVNVEPVQN